MSSNPVSTLWDLVLEAAWAGNDYTIYAKEPWEKNSLALLVLMNEYGDPAGAIPAGFSYFLEISVCKELLEGIAEQYPSTDQRFERIVHYAKYDA